MSRLSRLAERRRNTMTETQLIFYPPTRGRGPAIDAGFRFGHIGTHTCRTIMLDELGATFEAVPPEAKPAEYATAIIDANCRREKDGRHAPPFCPAIAGALRIGRVRADVPHSAPTLGDG